MIDLNALFAPLEAAVDSHPVLRRLDAMVCGTANIAREPSLQMDRMGCKVSIPVKVRKSNKKAHEIFATGETPEAARDALIAALDFWAEAI